MSLIQRIKETISRKHRWARIAVRQDAFEDDLTKALDEVRDELRRKRARLQLLQREGRRENERAELHDEIAALEAIRDTLIDNLDSRRHKSRRVAARLDEARDRLEELRGIRRRRAANDGPDSGEGAWAGTQSIIELEVLPVFARYGVPVTSLKRAADHPLSISNPSSDHNEANTNAYAADGATTNGDPVARAVATALGITGYSTGNYNGYTIYRAGGVPFRVQILWAVSGHFDHVHVGIRRL